MTIEELREERAWLRSKMDAAEMQGDAAKYDEVTSAIKAKRAERGW